MKIIKLQLFITETNQQQFSIQGSKNTEKYRVFSDGPGPLVRKPYGILINNISDHLPYLLCFRKFPQN